MKFPVPAGNIAVKIYLRGVLTGADPGSDDGTDKQILSSLFEQNFFLFP